MPVLSNSSKSIETAVAVPYTDQMRIRCIENKSIVIEMRKITIHFSKDKKVAIRNARDVFLYSGFGIHIREAKAAEFQLEFLADGITTMAQSWRSEIIYFRYGDALFYIDQENRIVKVWSSWFWFDFSKGFVGIGLPVPRPNLTLWSDLGPLEL